MSNLEFEYGRSSRLLDKKYREFFIPTVLTAMATSASIIVDGIIVGNLLGSRALAAVNILLPVMMLYTIVAVLLGMGAATVISVARGRRENALADTVFTVALAGMLVLGLLLVWGQLAFREQILLGITTDPVLGALAGEYLDVLILASPLLVLVPGMVYILRTDGKVKLGSAVLITANGVNLCMDILLIRFFGMGIRGSSMATLLGYMVGLLVLLTYFRAPDRGLRLDLSILTGPAAFLRETGRIMGTGLPNALSASLMPLKILLLNRIVLQTSGQAGMAVFSVCLSCLSLVSMFIAGAAQTMSPIAGTLFGEKDHRGIGFVVRRAAWVLFLANLVILGILQMFPGAVLSLFGLTDPAEMELGIRAVRIFSLSLPGTSVSFLLLYYYMTVGQKKIATIISLLQGLVLVVPLAWLLARWRGIDGVWTAFILAEALTMAAVLAHYLLVRRRSGNRIRSILLLENPAGERERHFDLSIRNRLEDAVGLSEKIIGMLKTGGTGEGVAVKVGLVIEELVVNTIRHGYSRTRDRSIDIRVAVLENEIIIALRDDGDYFDPVRYYREGFPETPDGVIPGGIPMVHAMAKTVEYNRILGLNNTRIVVAAGI